MTDTEYQNEIAKVQEAFGMIAQASNVGVVVPAAMNIVLSAILSIGDKTQAMRATQSLRPMIDYIESRLQGVH